MDNAVKYLDDVQIDSREQRTTVMQPCDPAAMSVSALLPV